MNRKNKLSPKDAWCKITDEFFKEKKTMKQKGCPKDTFLGLCEEGLIKGIPKGEYTRSKENKKYGLIGLQILKSYPNIDNAHELWNKVMKKLEKNINHNNQMDVVLALWKKNLIDTDKI